MDEKIYIGGMQKEGGYIYIKPAYSFGERIWKYEDKLRNRKEIDEIEEIFSDGIIRLKINDDDILEIFEFTKHLKSKSDLYLAYERVNLDNDKLLSIKPRNPFVYGKIMEDLSRIFKRKIHVSICERPEVIKRNKDIPTIHINPDLKEEHYKEFMREKFEGKGLKNTEVEIEREELSKTIEKICTEFEEEIPPIYVSDGKTLMTILPYNNEIRISSENYENLREKLTEEK